MCLQITGETGSKQKTEHIRALLSSSGYVRLREHEHAIKCHTCLSQLNQVFIRKHTLLPTRPIVHIFRTRTDFDFYNLRENLSFFEHSQFLPVLLLLYSLNSFALKAAQRLSLHISHCHSRQDVVDTKDEGSHQTRLCSRRPETLCMNYAAFRKLLSNLSERLTKKVLPVRTHDDFQLPTWGNSLIGALCLS